MSKKNEKSYCTVINSDNGNKKVYKTELDYLFRNRYKEDISVYDGENCLINVGNQIIPATFFNEPSPYFLSFWNREYKITKTRKVMFLIELEEHFEQSKQEKKWQKQLNQ